MPLEATMHSAYVVATTFDLRLLVNVRGYVRPLTYAFVSWFECRLITLVATVVGLLRPSTYIFGGSSWPKA